MDEYEKQHKVPIEKTKYGIRQYTPLQKELSEDIMRLLKSKKYKEIPADDCLIVFGRVYSIYVTSKLIKDGKLRFSGHSKKRGVKP